MVKRCSRSMLDELNFLFFHPSFLLFFPPFFPFLSFPPLPFLPSFSSFSLSFAVRRFYGFQSRSRLQSLLQNDGRLQSGSGHRHASAGSATAAVARATTGAAAANAAATSLHRRGFSTAEDVHALRLRQSTAACCQVRGRALFLSLLFPILSSPYI